MKKTVKPGPIEAIWNPDDLFNKALLYVQQTEDLESDQWQYALWLSLSLEFLARAALANISPALLAETENKQWGSLYHALGFVPKEQKYSPKSIGTAEVFKRLNLILDDFTQEHENFGILHTGNRNSELHTGKMAFEGVNASTWQPRFYGICQVLLASMGKSLEELFGKDEAKAAKKLIAAAADEGAKAIQGDVAAHKKVWEAKPKAEQKALTESAAIWATRHVGHRVACPSCGSQSLLHGEPVGDAKQQFFEGEIVETQEYLPTHFECVACALKITGLSRLSVVKLGDRYKKTQRYDAAELYAPEDKYDGYEDDNNER
ncbi:hypothetical protein [uncultured Bosea sp.]|uniref:hypothetical protein n=1 Tax=uncultured Bosea sp. TaxID=211457 RepID=UPI0025D6DB37|nr:hypothetical protein [uncultured Bosea sp.]